MSKEENLFTAEQGAYMTRMALSSFRTRVSKLGFKGTKQGVKVLYSRKQLEAIYKGTAAKTGKTAKVGKAKKSAKKAQKRSGQKPQVLEE